jgi:hypothetical protein
LAPSHFDKNGLASFAPDSYMYHPEALDLSGVLKTQGVISWAVWPSQLHVRLYSLPVAVFGYGNNFNILTIEVVNLIYYLAILALIYKVAKLVFGYRASLIATATVALWPSFLLHTTQILRDPLLVAAFLVLILVITLVLKHDYLWWQGILIGAAGTIAIVLIRIVRMPLWNVLWVTAIAGVLFLFVRLLHRHRFPAGNIAFALILIASMTVTPRFQSLFRNQQTVRRPWGAMLKENPAGSLEEQIEILRNGFGQQFDANGQLVASTAGSDIDLGIQFKSKGDILRYLPRAAIIGFFAPFPNMWLAGGKQVGAVGRSLSGFEMLMSYMFECLALVGLWRKRKDVSAWFLCGVIACGAISLGLIVANVGALFRFRYPFWALLIICGAGGVDFLFCWMQTRKSSKPLSDLQRTRGNES